MTAHAQASTEWSALNPDRHFLLRHMGFDIAIAQAHGHYYQDEGGTTYLDFLAQYGAVPFGHNPAVLWDILHAHSKSRAPTLVQPLTSVQAERLGKRLVALAPGDMRYATFTNSGAETVEAAIKLSRARTRRPVILAAERGFHGKTLGALSATGNPDYQRPFLLDTTRFDHIPYDDLEALEARLRGGDVAAFIVEPVQGEGGMRVPSPGYLSQAAQLCRQAGTLFVLDEIQTGFARTGALFAASAEPGLSPDILLLSKALGGGLLPIGVMLCTAAAWSEEFGLLHSSTFANSNLACAVGNGVLDMLMKDDWAVVDSAREAGRHLELGLDGLVNRFPRTFLRRTGRGLMQGLVLAGWNGEDSYFAAHASYKGLSVPLIAGCLLKRHRIVTAAVFNQQATLRLQPSLTIERAEIDRVVGALAEIGEEIQSGNVARVIHAVASGKASHQADAPSLPRRHAPTYRVATDHERRLGSFAFLIHPTDENVLFNTLPGQCAEMPAAARQDLLDWMRSWFSRMYDPAPVYHLPALRSKAGGYVEGWLIAAPLTPSAMMRLPPAAKRELLAAYMDVARRLKVDMVGLGAFTSVISRGGTDIQQPGVPLTTGNSLTAIAAAESLRLSFGDDPSALAGVPVAVIGAAGSVGRLAALHLARFARGITLFGNPANPNVGAQLRGVGGEIYAFCAARALGGSRDEGLPALLREVFGEEGLKQLLADHPVAQATLVNAVERRFLGAGLISPITYSSNPQADLRHARAVLSASGAGRPFLDPALFGPGSIVCDVARPLDVLGTLKDRTDLRVYEGGLMRLPEEIAFGAQNVLGYPRGLGLACLSETVTLAMDGTRQSVGIGAPLDYDQALAIHERALHHGFSIHAGAFQDAVPQGSPHGVAA